MPLNSTPSGATVIIVDETGTEVFKGETPTSVPLEKSAGKYGVRKAVPLKYQKMVLKHKLFP